MYIGLHTLATSTAESNGAGYTVEEKGIDFGGVKWFGYKRQDLQETMVICSYKQ